MYEYNPKVSIIIPVYNGANFLREAIDSALSQTYKNIEVIVVNDGSTDEGATETIAKQYGDRIRYYHKENGGVSSALNLGISKMTGEWFSWLSHDDLYLPKKVEHSVDVLNKYLGDCDRLIVYSDGELVREDTTKIMPFHRYFDDGKIYSGIEAAHIMARKGTLCGCCLLIPKQAFECVGGFDESLRYSQDSLMWYRLFLSGYSVAAYAHKDVLSRVHKKQVTNTRKDLFVHDSLYLARTIAPILLRTHDTKDLYYSITKRYTRLNCDATVDYLIDFASQNSILLANELECLRREKIRGRLIYRAKAFVRKLLTF